MTAHRKDPYRIVTSAYLNDDHLGRWWGLSLECGHDDVRPVKYVDHTASRGGYRTKPVRDVHDVSCAPRRIRCEECGLIPRVGPMDSPRADSTHLFEAEATHEPDALPRSA